MCPTRLQQSNLLVAEARSWVGTPYHLGARVKGAGVDCATLLAECLIACGLAEREDLGVYSHDWFHHAPNERYLMALLRHAAKTLEGISSLQTCAEIAPGDLALSKVAGSKRYNHGGIVTAWPRVVHAIDPAVEECDASRHYLWAHHEIAVFRPRGV